MTGCDCNKRQWVWGLLPKEGAAHGNLWDGLGKAVSNSGTFSIQTCLPPPPSLFFFAGSDQSLDNNNPLPSIDFDWIVLTGPFLSDFGVKTLGPGNDSAAWCDFSLGGKYSHCTIWKGHLSQSQERHREEWSLPHSLTWTHWPETRLHTR